MMEGRLSTAKAALEFMLAGNARFTLRSVKTSTRYTYRVAKCKDNPNLFFVSYLVGTDNDNDYAYIGILANQAFKLTNKSKLNDESLPVKAISWAVKNLFANALSEQLEIWHEGSCGRCGRTLTVPESVHSGFGPECIKHVGHTHAH